MLLMLLAVSCIRPSDLYDVHLIGAETQLQDVLPAPEPMGGMIEYARYRLWGTNLGHGVTGMYGDSPRADGTGFVIGTASFGYPRDPGFDRNTSNVRPGPTASADGDACLTRIAPSGGYLSIAEYVDVGDHLAFVATDRTHIRMERDPSVHPRPAGESWYVGYGGQLGPEVSDHPLLPDTWRSDEAFELRFPGTIVPSESTLGSVPYPLSGATVYFPQEVADLSVNGFSVRPPHHYYDASGAWIGDDALDDVRFEGPWRQPMLVTWLVAGSPAPLTITVRYLGSGDEGSCTEDVDCGDGFHCDADTCQGDEGAGWNVLGEVSCTVADDGQFVLTVGMMQDLFNSVSTSAVRGAVLLVSRMTQGTVTVPDALTYNGKRVVLSPVRTRVVDTIVTRLDAP